MVLSKGIFMKNKIACIISLLLLFIACDVIAQKTPDNTYGPGGTKEIFTKGNFQTEIIRNANGTMRYMRTFYYSSETRESLERIFYYDCNLMPRYELEIRKKDGVELEFTETLIDERGYIISSVTHGIEGNGNRYVQSYNKYTRGYDYQPLDYKDKTLPNGNYKPDTTPCPPHTSWKINGTGDADLYVGFSVIDEDSKPKSFATFGGQVGYAYPVSPWLGLAVQGNINFGSNGGVDYTKYSMMGGVDITIFQKIKKISETYNLPEKPMGRGKVTRYVATGNGLRLWAASVKAMGGWYGLESKFPPGKTTISGFTIQAGPQVNIRLTNQLNIQTGVYWNPTFYKSNTSNNIKGELSLGIHLRNRKR